jgi:hypothetical protein
MPGKRACPVLRGRGRSNALPLPDPTPVAAQLCGTWKPRRDPAWQGRWADREEGRSAGGNRMAKKRMPAAERQRETRDMMGGPSAARAAITGRIRAAARTRKGADVAR